MFTSGEQKKSPSLTCARERASNPSDQSASGWAAHLLCAYVCTFLRLLLLPTPTPLLFVARAFTVDVNGF